MFGLASLDKLALQAHRPVLEARRRLKEGVPDGELYDVVLLATGSEEQASEALSDRIAERLRRGERPDL